MDPYLEGPLWRDVHHELASRIREQLTPQLRPRYVARLETTLIEVPEDEQVRVFVPDVQVSERRGAGRGPVGNAAVMTAPVLVPVPEILHRQKTIEVRTVPENELVASIEILSPANKTGREFVRLQEKRETLRRQGVHLVEIDLLRRGRRVVSHPRVDGCSYLVTVLRSHAEVVEAWPVGIRDALPPVPVPLLDDDPDAAIDLREALAAVYDAAGYDLDIDYADPPPPPALSGDDLAWARAVVASAAAAR